MIHTASVSGGSDRAPATGIGRRGCGRCQGARYGRSRSGSLQRSQSDGELRRGERDQDAEAVQAGEEAQRDC